MVDITKPLPLPRFDHLVSLSKKVSPSGRGGVPPRLGGVGGGGGEEVQERAQQLVTERQALRESLEKRNKKLRQCCELQVCPRPFVKHCRKRYRENFAFAEDNSNDNACSGTPLMCHQWPMMISLVSELS